jgi:hypothetical protein
MGIVKGPNGERTNTSSSEHLSCTAKSYLTYQNAHLYFYNLKNKRCVSNFKNILFNNIPIQMESMVENVHTMPG